MNRRGAIADFARDSRVIALLAVGRYFVSEDGTIFDRHSGEYRVPSLDADGHPVLQLTECGTIRVSRLVALQFLGAPPRGQHHVGHLNDLKTDNRAINLRWRSPTETSAVAHAAGKIPHPVGQALPSTKLTPDRVSAIRRALDDGVSMRETAHRFGVTKGAVDGIKYGKSWRHL